MTSPSDPHRPDLPTHPELPGNRGPTSAGAEALKVLICQSSETMTAAANALPSAVLVRELRQRGWRVMLPERVPEHDCASECSGQDEDVDLIAREAVEDD